jgi:predicted transcriptional regulator
MTKSVSVTARLDDALLAALDTHAKELDRSRSWVIEKALKDYLERDAAFLAAIEEGIAEADAGLCIPHEEAMRQLDENLARWARFHAFEREKNAAE